MHNSYFNLTKSKIEQKNHKKMVIKTSIQSFKTNFTNRSYSLTLAINGFGISESKSDEKNDEIKSKPFGKTFLF